MSTHSNNQPLTPQITRQKKLSSILQSLGLDALVLNAGPSLTYLTGLHFHLSERPVVCIFTPGGNPVIILPELEQEKLKGLAYPLVGFTYGEDPAGWSSVFKRAVRAADITGKRTGIEPRQLRLLEYRLMVEAHSAETFVPAEDCVASLRMFKDEGEVACMRKAASIAEQALTATLPYIKIGRTEKEVATELTLQLFRAGCDPQMPFTPIVSAGPNSANPHATPSDRKLASGDLLVIDWGAGNDGYCSDITRTFALGKLEPEYENICEIELEANSAGRQAVNPGVPIENVDRAARNVIQNAGYGQYFTHRTGHGIGMEGHEEPYIRAGNTMPLQPGMAFTIEPGIYLPGRNGVRIEDDVVVTETGVEVLTSLPREVIEID